MDKKDIRKKYKELRNQLTENEIEEGSLQIANQLLHLDIWQHNFYHLFLPIENLKEVNTEYILQVLAGKDKNIVLSKSDFSTKKMTHFLLTDSVKIRKNEYNIPEPVDGLEVPVAKINVVFVPLLAFDEIGNRVGYGKGFYDKFLAQCLPNTIKIGLSFFEPEKTISPILPTDIQLDFCVTPLQIFKF